MPRKPLAMIIILALLMSTGIYFYNKSAGKEENKIIVSGTIESTEIDVAAEVSGKLQVVNVEEGQMVKVGDVLAKIDPTIYELQVKQQEALLKSSQAKASETKSGSRQELIEQAKANVKQVTALVKAAGTAVDSAEDNYQRIKALYETAAATEQQFNAAETQLQAAKAQFEANQANLAAAQEQLKLLLNGATLDSVNIADAGVSQSQAGLELAKAQRLKTIITAPAEALVGVVNIQKGEFVNAGSKIVTLLDTDDLWVKVYIPETKIPKIKIGQETKIFVDAYPGKAFKGEIVYISPNAEFTPKNLQTKEERVKTVFAVKVKVKDGIKNLKPGLPADVEIEL